MLNRWVLLAGLSLMAHAAIAQGADRKVDVQVAAGAIKVAPDPVNMAKNQNRIEWTLNSDGYSFAANGIVIKDANGDYGDCGPVGNKGKKFACKKLRHIDHKDFKYDVNLKDVQGQPLSLDPIIHNE